MTYHKLPTKYIDQISLNVTDIERSVMFYRDVLGMNLLSHTIQRAVFSFEGETPVLTIVQPDDVKTLDRGKTGLFHIAYLVPSRSDLADVVYYFWKNQLPVQGASDHYVSEAFYLSDPDGYGIEIYRDREPNEWKWNGEHVEMATVPLDIEDLLKERSEEGWTGFPKDSTIGHIHLQVHDLQAVKPFYETLGFDVVANYGAQALFMADQYYHHHIGLNTWGSRNGEPKHDDEVGLNWYSVKMTEQDREQVKENLERQVQEQNGQYIAKDPAGIEVRF
ncbi:VOC family protein [Aquisalibacillus elongatus]|uniref:Catechol 2,3-dioxygenase n=1 Tax=Aquisalibacillus elongatus TaxID=485577 RepID=A0A3N5C3N0_9BACI|nr:VOC family protein [Aquisalibacillus elongatus]RPF54072.1 catechol 2,3-dioxygenase [Aquisalibacillus elongatus]